MLMRNKGRGMFGAKVLVFLLVAIAAQAATLVADSCSVADVSAKVTLAANGDTVVIPDGQCTWVTGITVTKQITIQGQTVPSRTAGATNGTTITYGAGAGSDNLSLFEVTIGSSNRTTIANLRFLPGTSCLPGDGCGKYIGMGGTGLVPLMHDMYFGLLNFQLRGAVSWNVTGGVIWNTTFESTYNLNGACGTQVGSDSGSLVVDSNKNWDDASTMGMADTNGDQNLYIEDSEFKYVGQIPDVAENGRVVIRHSTWDHSSGLNHGVTGPYGGRHTEIYDNTFIFTNINRGLSRWFWFRGGTAVITGNNIQAINSAPCYQNASSLQFIVESATRSSTHGCCTGYQCFHQPGTGSNGTTHSPSNMDASQSPNDTYQMSEPVYIWNNTGTGAASDRIFSTNDSDLSCNTGFTTTNFFVSNRDYFVDNSGNPSNGAKPGWTRYTYPHPLAGTSTGGGSRTGPKNTLAGPSVMK